MFIARDLVQAIRITLPTARSMIRGCARSCSRTALRHAQGRWPVGLIRVDHRRYTLHHQDGEYPLQQADTDWQRLDGPPPDDAFDMSGPLTPHLAPALWPDRHWLLRPHATAETRLSEQYGC